MKERIRKAIKKGIANNPSLAKELELIDQAYITTFDSFALSVVKKYHYLLNISNDIGISDASIIDMQKIKIMDQVFDKYYENPTQEFNKLIYVLSSISTNILISSFPSNLHLTSIE